MSAPSLPAAAEPVSLTHALQRAGMLGDGHVREVSADPPRDMVLSRLWRLRLAYDGNAADAPPTLILKARLPQAPGNVMWGAKEVAFYKSVAPATPAGLVPRCYEAEWQAESRHWHLLLEDLTDSHRIATPWPIAPSEADCRAIVGVQARFHAAWWDDRRLGVSVGAWVGAEESQRIGQYIEGCYRKFAESRAHCAGGRRSRLPRPSHLNTVSLGARDSSGASLGITQLMTRHWSGAPPA